MHLEISHISPNIRPEEFRRRCYLPGRPAVMKGVARDWPATCRWTRQHVMDQLERSSGRATRQLLWWNLDGSLLEHDVPTPFLIEAIRQGQKPSTRSGPRRLWLSDAGERTHWRHNGPAVEVLRVQIVGRKRYTILSPETPLAGMRSGPRRKRVDVRPDSWLTSRHRYGNLELEAGDLLYLPQHWYYFEESLDVFNASIDWTWSDPRRGAASTALSGAASVRAGE